MTKELHITSRGNARFKRWLQLLDSRGIRKEQQFLLFGERVVQETLECQQDHCVEILYPPSWPSVLSAPATVAHYPLERSLFKDIDVFGTGAPILVCQTPEIRDWNPESAPEGLELMCPLGDPRNVGAVVRTCQAFGVQRVILLREAASPFHPASTRSASGAVLNVEWVQGPSIHDLHHNDSLSTLVALDARGKELATFQWPKHVRLLIGEEGQGLPKNNDAEKIAIRMAEGMGSLNAAMAVGIAMYAYRLQHPLGS